MSFSLKNVMQSFPEFDRKISMDSAMTAVNDLGGLDADGKLQMSSPDFQRATDFQSATGHSREHLAMIEDMFNKRMDQYADDTNQFILYNDLANVNRMADDTIHGETARLNRLLNTTTNESTKARASFRAMRYQIMYNKFKTAMIQVTLAFVIVASLAALAFLHTKISLNVLVLTLAILCVVYLLVMVAMIKQTQTRRRDDWTKFYFN